MKNIFKIEIDANRVFGLDILRALAILFVTVGHAGALLKSKQSRITDQFIFDGVSIFFVLSGFLIGGILIRKINKNGINKKMLLNFWIRRWFRTLPNYFLILIILCILNLSFAEGFNIRSIYSYFIFSQNLFRAHPDFFPEAWSLSVEEWFYLLVPISIAFITFILKTSYKKGILFTSISLIVLVTLFRYSRYSFAPINNNFTDWDINFRRQVITRLDSLMFGVIGAYINYYYYHLWIKHKMKFFLLGTSIFLFSKYILDNITQFNGVFSTVFSFSIISIATLFLLPYLSEFKTGKGFLYKPISYISLISYSMYLLNLSIIKYWIIDNIHWYNFMNNGYLIVLSRYGLFWLLLISFSILLYKYFEIPMTKLRENEKIKRWL